MTTITHHQSGLSPEAVEKFEAEERARLAGLFLTAFRVTFDPKPYAIPRASDRRPCPPNPRGS